jgi:hypothetical protein
MEAAQHPPHTPYQPKSLETAAQAEWDAAQVYRAPDDSPKP